MLEICKNIIKEKGYDIKDEAKLSSIFGIGNGYFGIRGSFEEFGDVFIQGCYIRGVFDEIIEIPQTFADNEYMKRYYFDVEKLKTFEYQDSCTNICDPTTIKFYVDGKLFLPWEGKIIKWTRYIDFKTGGLIRNVIWDDGNGNQTEFKFERYCSFNNNHLFIQKASIRKLNHNLKVKVIMGIDTLVKTNGQHKSQIIEVNNIENKIELLMNQGKKYNMNVAISSRNNVVGASFEKAFEEKGVYGSTYIVNDDYAEVKKVVAMYATCDNLSNIFARAYEDSLISYDEAYKNHIKSYRNEFSKCDIKIKGDNELDVLLRYANYQTLIGFDRYDSIHSLSAKNLTAEKYNQFVWWDAEIFQLPFLIHNYPKAARSCLEYRYRCLDAARQNAKRDGYDGAKFAFCSSVNGDEKVWEYARHPFLQIHISGDVAYGVYNYYRNTNDDEFMTSMGLEMMIEVIKYFYSRSTHQDGLYHILNVTGTDEHHPYINDNAYTNYEVQFIANKTLEYIKKFNYKVDETTLHKINELNEKMYLPQPNKKGIIPQFEGYLNLKPYLPIVGNGAGTGFQMKASGLYHQSQIIKQPDVLNLFTYIDVDMDKSLYKNNWKYYEKMCEASSSLTYPVHTIAAIDNKEEQKFLKLLKDTLTIDINDINNCAVQGVHAGCLAGGWYAIFHGLFGITTKQDYLYINPCFNKLFNSVTISFIYKNVRFKGILTKNTLTLKTNSDEEITIIYKNKKKVFKKQCILK